MRRSTLTAQHLSLAGAPSRRQRASGQQHSGRPRPGPEQNPVPDAVKPHRTSYPSDAAAAVAPEAPHAAPAVALPVAPEPARRVLRPSRDPDADTTPRHDRLSPHG